MHRSCFHLLNAFRPALLFNRYFHTQMVHDGLTNENEMEVVMLTRSAWAGMQRWGAALWSGDTLSAFSTLKTSIQAGLNTQMSGMQKLLFLCARVPSG